MLKKELEKIELKMESCLEELGYGDDRAEGHN